jgi:replicative DNA helicase
VRVIQFAATHTLEWRDRMERELAQILFVVPKRIRDVEGVLSEEHFRNPRARSAFRAIMKLHHAGEPIEPAFFLRAFEGEKPTVALMELLDCHGNDAFFGHRLRAVLGEHQRERIRDLSALLAETNDGEVREALSREMELERSSAVAVTDRDATLGSIATHMSERALAGQALGEDGIPTPWRDLNRAIYGLEPGTLVLIAARPQQGKSVFVMQLAVHCARLGAPVHVFSLEMRRESLTTRLLSSLSGVDHGNLRRGFVRDDERASIHDASREIAQLPLTVDDAAGLTIQEISALAKARKACGGLGLIVVDYAQLARDKTAERRFDEMSNVSRALKAMSKELNVPVVAAAQLSRDAEEQPPRLSHLKETGQFEQDADVVIALWGEKLDPGAQSWTMKAFVLKNRQGPGGIVDLIFQRHLARFVSKEPV